MGMISEYSRAVMFADSAHRGQKRKYTGEPYINHPITVAALISQVFYGHKDMDQAMAIAALHDVIEDCGVTEEELANEFGLYVASSVRMLSDPEVEGNRRLRKTAAREQISRGDYIVQTIKLADMIDNTASILRHDPKFWPQYRIEKLMLLGAMFNCDQGLWSRAYDICVRESL